MSSEGVEKAGPSPGLQRSKLSRRGLFVQALPAIKVRLGKRDSFERRLCEAVSEAKQRGEGFYLGGLAARRALGAALIINVDPKNLGQRVRHRVVLGGKTQVIRDRFIGAGDWDALLDPVQEGSTYQDVSEIVRAEGDFKQTRAYRNALTEAARGTPISRNFTLLKTPQLIENYFSQIAGLVKSIKQNGIVRRAEYRRLSHVFNNRRVRLPWVELAESDIGVAIGARGQIFRFASGKHRTAVAQTLGLASIPVEVRVVHAQWLERQVANFGPALIDALVRGVRGLDNRAR